MSRVVTFTGLVEEYIQEHYFTEQEKTLLRAFAYWLDVHGLWKPY